MSSFFCHFTEWSLLDYKAFHGTHLKDTNVLQFLATDSYKNIVGTLPPNAVFWFSFTSGLSPRLPNSVYRNQLAKSCAPILGVQEDTDFD